MTRISKTKIYTAQVAGSLHEKLGEDWVLLSIRLLEYRILPEHNGGKVARLSKQMYVDICEGLSDYDIYLEKEQNPIVTLPWFKASLNGKFGDYMLMDTFSISDTWTLADNAAEVKPRWL